MPSSQRLVGRTALVTGASRGIGAGIAKKLAAEGAAVAVNYSRSAGPADEVVAAITKAGGKAVAVKGDISDPAAIAGLFDAAEKALGKLDVLVNNAGVADMAPLEKIDAAHIARQFGLNVTGLLLCCQEAAKRFGKGGTIVNVSSNVATTTTIPGASVYTATKAAVNALTRVLAAELGPKGVTINAVAPGFTATDLNKDMPAAMREQVIHQTALGRLGAPDDIAGVVALLCSADAAWVTGEVLPATGGLRG